MPQAEVAPELSPGSAAPAVLTLLRQDRGKVVALVGHEPDLGFLLTMKKNAVVCVSFEGAPSAGRAVLKWLATPRMLRGLRRN